ncbi:hypothetical protein BRC97_12715 [Halobacteriales archaeon QS_6_71_20]|nr:MAG: hypothetical protein BRC97_12715 [Halobacteriales archaeon QS_6_71_20]
MQTTGRAVGRLSTAPVEEGVESLCRAAACDNPDVAAGLAVLGLTAAFLLAVGAVLARLDGAREADIEAGEVARATPRAAGTDALATPAGGSGADDAGLAETRRAYRETVMATPHYEEEYDETLTENVAEEFSGAVAGALVEKGGALTPALQATLAGGAERARRQRTELLSRLETEESSLEDARGTLASAVEAAERTVERDLAYAGYSDIVGEYERLEWHERRVETVLSDRQGRVHDEESERRYWFEYLYDSLPSPYPVLSAGTETLSLLSEAKASLTAAASER